MTYPMKPDQPEATDFELAILFYSVQRINFSFPSKSTLQNANHQCLWK